MKRNDPSALKSNLIYLLIMLMIIRICSYFMLSESVMITQVIKTGLRLLVTVISFFLLRNVFKNNPELRYHYPYPIIIILYISFLLLGMFSILWSSKTEDSILQLMMDTECLAFCFLFINLLTAYHTIYGKSIRLSQILSVSIFIILIGFIAGMYTDPDKFYRLTHGGEVARLGGFIINPNELGMLIVVGFAMCCSELTFTRKRLLPAIMIGVFIYTLVLTGSRSSMIGFFLIVLFYVNKSKSTAFKISILAILLLSVPFIINQIFIKAGDAGEVLNMTGRIPFWKDLLSINFPKEPILGYGYMRIDYQDRFESLNSYTGAMTHNTFIQVLLNLGLAGLLIVLLQLGFTIHRMMTEGDSGKMMTATGLLIPALINSFTEFGIFGETNYGIMFYLFIVFMYGMGVNKSVRLPYNKSHHAYLKESSSFRPVVTPGPFLRR